VLEAKLKNEYYPPRALSILHQINRAITASPEPVPDIEFSFVVKDLPDELHAHHTFWALSRLPVDKETWLMPDFGYWSWPLDLVGSYEQIRVEIIQNQKPWEERVPKILWRGALKTNKVREAMYRITRGKKWADIEEIKWENRTEVSPASAASAISMVDHCDYQYLMHTEGRSYSGRGKYLLNCGSVVVMHKSEWIEPHQDLYVKSGPEQNIVEVERDFSDLEEKMQKLLNDPQLARQIAMNSQKTFRDRYLTSAAQACYWRKVFRS
jgi:spore maturation protein CgeB